MTQPNSRFPNESSPDPDELEDIPLVSFLRANASEVPEPDSELEDRLMQSILLDSPSLQPIQPVARRRHRWNGRILALIGVGLATVGVGLGQLQQWFVPSGLSTVEMAQVESFMIDSWDEAVEPSVAPAEWEWLETQSPVIRPGSPTAKSLVQ